MEMMKNKYALFVVLTLFLLSGLFSARSIFAKQAELNIALPLSGEMIHGFQLVKINLKGSVPDNTAFYLSLIDLKGTKQDLPLSTEENSLYANIDTREFQDGALFLVAWANNDEIFLMDSEVISVIVDNRSHVLDVSVNPSLSRSGSELTFQMSTSIIIKKAYVELDNGTRIFLNNNKQQDLWAGSYFIPFTWNEGTHFLTFHAEDSSGKTLSSSSSFIICNSEPFIEFPQNLVEITKPFVSVKGRFQAGKTVYIAVNGKLVSETKTDLNGEWVFQKLELPTQSNDISVFSSNINLSQTLFPYQKIRVKVSENSLFVLSYHNIASKGNIYTRSAELFEADLIYLKENGFHVVSPTLLMSYFDGKADLPANPVVITFDDGYIGVFSDAYPILKKHDLSVLFFVLTSRVGVFRDFVTWEQLSELQSSRVFSIESHTHNSHFYVNEADGLHAALTSKIPLPDGTLESHTAYRNRVKEDLLKSKDLIESKINKKVHFLSVPFGNANKEVNDIAIELGFKATFNSDGGLNALPLKALNIKRISIKRDDKIEDIVH
jgi:peptidoglycan/xylan/chitin deacetylase (PgdA/CDA1 family)